MVSSNWDRVSLGDVCRVEAGAGFPIIHQGLKDQEFPFFKVGDMNTTGNEKEMHVFQHSISEEIRKKLRATAFPAGTIVFPKIGAAIATNKKRMIVKPSCVDNNVMALIPSENLDSSFLFYLLLNKDLSDFANTGNPPSIRQSNVEEWAIPLPPLTEQKRIASLLARADRLRQLRRTAHDLGDALLQSVFLEMFGDFNRYEKVLFDELAIKSKNSFANGPFGSNLLTTELVSKGVPVLYIRDISSGYYQRVSKAFVTPQKAKELDSCRADGGDVLIAKVGDPPGTAAVYPISEPAGIISQDVIRIKPNREIVNPEYLARFINSEVGRNILKPILVEGTRERFGLTPMKQLAVPLPPLSLQEEFAGVVARVESLRGRIGESARQVEGLFESLLAQSFDGGR